MADRKQQNQTEVSKIDALYSWLSYDLQRIKGEILNVLNYSSRQVSSLYDQINAEKQGSAEAMKESVAAITQEIRFSYKQNQSIHDGLQKTFTGDVAQKLDAISEQVAALPSVETVEELKAQLANLQNPSSQEDVLAALSETLQKVENAISAINEKIAESNAEVLEGVAENGVKLDEVKTAVEAIAIPEISVPEIDYARIEAKIDEAVATITAQKVAVDYERIINGSAEKIIEAMPYPEKVDYRRITEITENAVALAVEKALSALNVDAIANAVAEKLSAPAEVDYDRLADVVVAKMAANSEANYEVVLDDDGIEAIAKSVSEKIEVSDIDYEKLAPQPVDYDRISEIVEDKLAEEAEPTYDLVIDQEGIEAIAKSVSEKICDLCSANEEVVVADATEETVEEPVEETAEEIVEETVEEPVEETVEEPVEETVEEIVEEPIDEEARAAEEAEARKEIAISVVPEYREVDNQLVDAETGLVIRLKRSFTAKIRQSDERVKGYYSDIKNELTSYKKINSNVSWHGDRFNFGRDTVAKINICGKTLCFYLALDPNDPEYKTTVYHQKDVGDQKAYESTPFMVKIKSDAAAKKALRLVGFLAEKIGTEKDEKFEAVDYVEECRYQSTKQLFEDGFIKVTKEKKVDLDF